MLERIADSWVKKLIENGTVEEEKAALYVFGFVQGMRAILELILLLITGLLLGLFWQCVIILVTFMPIRVYAGGYHAKTPLQCSVKTWMLLLAILLAYRFLPSYLLLECGIVVVAGGWIWFFAPIEDSNKPLLDYELKKYRKKALLYFMLYVCIYVIAHMVGWNQISRCIAWGLGMLLFIMVAGVIKNRNWKKQEEEDEF